MKKLTIKLGVILTVLINTPFYLKAQTIVPFTFAGTSPVVLQMDSNGSLSSIGTFGTGTFSVTGTGTRMFWYPGKAAFRAGSVSGTTWDDASIGNYSAAFGNNSRAMGSNTFSTGGGQAIGTNAVALGGGIATGSSSFAVGANSSASGTSAFGMGILTGASGYCSFAFGTTTLATGSNSVSMGSSAQATGNYSTSFGSFTVASAYNSLVIGTYNVGGGNGTSWIATDPLFEIGNGISSSAKADAMVIYKNGNGQVHGTFRCAAGGDLSMGSFMSGIAP